MNEFQLVIQRLLAEAKLKLAGGLTLAEIRDLWNQFITESVQAAARYLTVTGPEKKAYVLAALAALFDLLAPKIPLPWFLTFVRPLLMGTLKTIVLTLADGTVEAIYQALKLKAALE